MAVSVWVRRTTALARKTALLAVVAAPVVAAAGWPGGSVIPESALVDVTEEGFASLEDVVTTFVPSSLALPDFGFAAESCSNPCDWFGGNCTVCLYDVDIDVTDLDVSTTIDELAITPAEQVLNLYGGIIVQLNSSGNPATLSYSVDGTLFPEISDTCDVYTKPITVEAEGAVELDVAPNLLGVDVDGDGLSDTKLLDATVPPLTWDWDADDTDIVLVGCGTATVINTLNDVLDFFGFDNIYELVLDQIEPNGPAPPAGEVQAFIDDLPDLVEPVIEDAFASLFVSETVDLLGVPITMTLWPDAVEVHAEGMRVALASATEVPPHSCMAAWDTGESLATASTPPGIGEAPSSLGFSPHAAVAVDDDFLNQVLYGAWSGGLLCVTLSEDNDPFGLPIALNTSLLGLVAPATYDDLFPTVQPLEIRTEPRLPPVLAEPIDSDVRIVDDGLGLNFITTIEGRKARLLSVDLAVDLGADLSFDGATGELTAAIGLEDAITPTVGYNEFRPESSAAVGVSFGLLIEGLVVPLAEPYLEGLAFPIPSLEGVGIVALDLAPAGSNGDYVGAFATTGPVSYASVGCGDSGGCDTSTCSSGCSSGGGAVMFVGMPLVFAALRRRAT